MYNAKKMFSVSILTCFWCHLLHVPAIIKILDALNAKEKKKFVSLFSRSVRDANPELDAMADEVMNFYQGTGVIIDDSYFGERGHNDHGRHSCFGSNLYSVDTDVKSYKIAIGNYVMNAFVDIWKVCSFSKFGKNCHVGLLPMIRQCRYQICQINGVKQKAL